MKNKAKVFGRAIVTIISSLLLLSVVVFVVAKLSPVDPLYAYYGQRVEKMKPEEKQQAIEKLGLDRPVFQQYLDWLWKALQGNFGISYKYKQNVLEIVGQRIGNTLLLGGIGFCIVFVGGLLVGLLSAYWAGSWFDKSLCKLSTILSCIPDFWIGMVLILLFSVMWGILPTSGAYYLGKETLWTDRMEHLILPVATIGIGHIGYYGYLLRNKLLEEQGQGYVLFYRANGFSKKEVVFRYCVRNAMPFYLGMMAFSVSHIVLGTYVVETVFGYPGIGSLGYESAKYGDYNLVMVITLLTGAMVMILNMLAEQWNQWIDPRLWLQKDKEGNR